MDNLRGLLQGFPAAERVFLTRSVDRELVLSFLMAFARAEHALKEAEFAEMQNGAITICWDRFARALGRKALESEDIQTQDAINYLTAHPPKKQVLPPKRWKKREPQRGQEPEFLVRSVTTVRNNLFHGGKEMTESLVERDQQLIRSSLLVLRHLVNSHELLREAFEITGPAHAG